jgi:hypothetical protein
MEEPAATATPALEPGPQNEVPEALIPEVLAPLAPPRIERRGRKKGTRVVRLKSGKTRAIAPEVQSPIALPAVLTEKGSKLAREIRESAREWLRVEFGWLQAQTKQLVEAATKEDLPRVHLVMKLWDKLVPDSREAGEGAPQNAINIQINNLKRGRPA